MPIYEYKCKKCGESFEALVRANEKPQCPYCSSKNLKKLPSSFSTTTRQKIKSRAPCGDNRECCGGCCHRCGM